MPGSLARVIAQLLDSLAPRRGRAIRTSNRTLDDIPLSPQSHRLLGASVTTIMRYRDAPVRDLIRSLKYDGSPEAARLAANLLADYLREETATIRRFAPQKILIAPVPLHPSRMRERGFNQIEIVLRSLPRELRDGTLALFTPSLLVRTRITPTQTRLSRHERIKNVRGAFALGDTAPPHGAHVILVDDVTTTGATLVSAAKPLRSNGSTVTLLALARA